MTYAASASYMKDGGIGINTDFSVLRSRQHLLQDHQEPYGRYDLRLLGDQRQRDPFERHRQLLDDSGPRHVHARHPPRLPRRRPARSGYLSTTHSFFERRKWV
ncbi:MAG: hypothetical protein ACLRMJ_14040 [Alistipes finegoldii]